MGEAEDGVAVEAVSVVTEGEPSPDAVLVESVKEFQPDLLAWLKKFKLQEPEMLEHMKKLEIYQARSQKKRTLFCCFPVTSNVLGCCKVARSNAVTYYACAVVALAHSSPYTQFQRSVCSSAMSFAHSKEMLRERIFRDTRLFSFACTSHSLLCDQERLRLRQCGRLTARCLFGVQASDLLKIQESQISSLNLKPAQQARFREGVVSLNAEQKPKTPTKARLPAQSGANERARELSRHHAGERAG